MRRFALGLISLACISTTFAATPINLRHQPVGLLQSMSVVSPISMKQISRDVDKNQTAHIRFQQYYSGYPVWGADAVAHVPNGGAATLKTGFNLHTSMNGTIYRDLKADLAKTPNFIFSSAQAAQAIKQATFLYQKDTGIKQVDLTNAKNDLMVYVDKNNKAHWVFLVKFLAESVEGPLAVPTYILDAETFSQYEMWNDAQTLDNIQGGGFGGNPKMGKLVYDGAKDNYPVLNMKRDSTKQTCYLQNADVTVLDNNHKQKLLVGPEVAQFTCAAPDAEHKGLYWDADKDAVNQGYSPANDALYIGQIIKELYQNWYGVPVLKQFGMPMMLKMNVHAKDFFGRPMDNAMFLSLNKQMYFGDGIKMFYPLTSLGVGAHEISHGFTSQHSNLTYAKQSGGLNEAFSDMAAQAAEFYSLGKNNWQIGPEIVKGEGALRYMDDPTKDGRSIANMKDYTDELNVHFTSGIYNKIFYLIGTAQGWDTKKAFNVMVKANMHYWTANSTFSDAACGVISATKDYGYNLQAVTNAMNTVGVDISGC